MISLGCPGRPLLPVGKIVAVGRNYADHAREMGHVPRREEQGEPILFLKPPSAVVVGGGAIELPRFSALVHHEVELVVRIGRDGRRWNIAEAAAAIDAIAVGLDLTARDLQNEARRRGDPWAVAKGFDQSAPLSPLVALDDPRLLTELELELTVNGTRRQHGQTRDLLLPVVELVAFVSSRFRLEAGDLLFTGTPAGVGPLIAGDVAEARLSRAGSNADPRATPLAQLAIHCVVASD